MASLPFKQVFIVAKISSPLSADKIHLPFYVTSRAPNTDISMCILLQYIANQRLTQIEKEEERKTKLNDPHKDLLKHF